MITHNRIETFIYFVIWSSGVVFSLYSLYGISSYYDHTKHDIELYEDFTPGWFGRYLDVSDYEWSSWTKLLLNLTPWFLANSIGAELLRYSKNHRQYIPYWYAAVTLAAAFYIINITASALFLATSLLFHFSAIFHVQWLGWIWAFLLRRYVPSEFFASNDEEIYLIEVATSWLLLRCLAYCMESWRVPRTSLPILLGYSLYLPSFFLGPLLSFPSFLRQCMAPPQPWTASRLMKIFRGFARCIFWYLFTIVALHFIYVNAVVIRIYIVESMTTWQLAGLGIALGHYFHLKYVVFYGLPSCWAEVEGYATPSPPCCVSRVYLYSHMWRYFDHGLYLFLVRYLYVPIVKWIKLKYLKRFVGSVVSFVFIYVWHGEGEYVLYWVLLNLAVLSIEAAARDVCSQPKVSQLLSATFSPANLRRLHCLAAAPLHYFSMISNFFFIGNLDIGKIYIHRAYNASLMNTISIIFFLYGAAQAALTIQMAEKNRL